MNDDLFSRAVAIVLDHEGGVADVKDDHGGKTYFGITRPFWNAYCRITGAAETDFDVLTREKAKDVYRVVLWDSGNFDGLTSESLATVVFDQSVLEGANRAITCLQKILAVPVDGSFGPITCTAANREQGDLLAFKFLRASAHHYVEIARKDSTQLKFLAGWIDRLFSLSDLVFFNDPQ